MPSTSTSGGAERTRLGPEGASWAPGKVRAGLCLCGEQRLQGVQERRAAGLGLSPGAHGLSGQVTLPPPPITSARHARCPDSRGTHCHLSTCRPLPSPPLPQASWPAPPPSSVPPTPAWGCRRPVPTLLRVVRGDGRACAVCAHALQALHRQLLQAPLQEAVLALQLLLDAQRSAVLLLQFLEAGGL